MGWRIGIIKNTVEISKKCARALFKAQSPKGEIWNELEDVTYKGKLSFNDDHGEWMDFLGSGNNEKFIGVLKKHEAMGDICFGSLEGDNAGSFWGYRFDGKGGMQKLIGEVTYKIKEWS